MTLPDYQPPVEVIDAPSEFVPEKHPQGSQFPPIQKIGDRLVIDVWWTSWRNDATAKLKIWRRADHPNLSALPANAPRAVKALYRAPGQLAYIRGDYILERNAFDAWAEYSRNSL